MLLKNHTIDHVFKVIRCRGFPLIQAFSVSSECAEHEPEAQEKKTSHALSAVTRRHEGYSNVPLFRA